MKQILQLAMGTAVCAAAAIVMTGCGKIAEKATEMAVEHSAGDENVDVKFDASGGSFTITDRETGMTAEVTQGEGTSVVVKSEQGDMTITGDDESFSMTSADGGMTVTAGDSAKVPDNFPKDVPVYDGLVLEFASAQQDESMYALNGTTKNALEEVFAFYKEKLAGAGWAEQTAVTESDMALLAFTKDKRSVTVNLTKGPGETGVAVAVYREAE